VNKNYCKKWEEKKIRWETSGLDFFEIETVSSSLIIFQSAELSTRSITHLLVQLKDILKEKRSASFTKGVLFLHDNASAHPLLATHKKLTYLGVQYLDHPPYSPSLVPSDYHLFLGLELRSVLGFVGSMLNKSRVWSL
jgi:hypothetical protein